MAQRDDVVGGVLLMMGFAILGPMIDVFAKLAVETLPAGIAVAGRFTIQTALLGLVVALRPGGERPPAADLPLHFLRGALMAAATLFFFEALRYMPIADAISIFFVEPLILTLLSAVLLGETVGWRRVVGCLIGFGGALLIVQPTFEDIGWPALLPLGTAVTFAFYMLLTRTLSARADVYWTQTLAGVGGGVVIWAALALEPGGPLRLVMPQGIEWAWIIGVGLAATLAHILIVLAAQRAPLSVIGPVQYLEIVSAAILGWLVFGDFPNAWKWVGIAIVVGSGLYVLHREQQAARRVARLADQALSAASPPPPDSGTASR